MHEETPPELKIVYVGFLIDAYMDTEVEVKDMYFSSDMWNVIESFCVDIDRYCDCEYDLSLTLFNKYVTEHIGMATRPFFKKLKETDFSPSTGHRRTVFMRLASSFCSLAQRTADVRPGRAGALGNWVIVGAEVGSKADGLCRVVGL